MLNLFPRLKKRAELKDSLTRLFSVHGGIIFMVKKRRISIFLKEGKETQFLSGLRGWTIEELRERFKNAPQVTYKIKKYIFANDSAINWKALDNIYRCESSLSRLKETLSLLAFFLETSAMASLSAAIESYCDGIDIMMAGLTARSNEEAFRKWESHFPTVDSGELHSAWIASGQVNREDYIRLYSSHPEILTRPIELAHKLREAAEKDYPVSLIADIFLSNSDSYESTIALPASYVSKIYSKNTQVLERGWEGYQTSEEAGMLLRVISMYEPSGVTLYYVDPFNKFKGKNWADTLWGTGNYGGWQHL